MELPFVLPQFDLPRAASALRQLLRNPDDLPQVFTIIEATAGTAPLRLLRGFRRTASGRHLLRERPDIALQLADREALRAMPAGSLGRAYLDFVESEGISPAGIRAASAEGARSFPGVGRDVLYVKERMRDTHDLWHAVTGYKGDVAGELALLAFILAQNWHTGIALIVLAAILKGYSENAGPLLREAFRRGRAARYLPPQAWESLLPLPLAEVRARLSVGPPPVYTPLRTAELRAQGML